MNSRNDTRRRFPPGFLWGAATAAHQVEGGNRWSDWWQYEQDGRLPYMSGIACDQLARYESDFDMARDMGHSCHRFSIEWSRIEPAEGQFSHEALEHYARVIAALRARGLEPVVTLQHFTLPAWLAARGGWLRRDAPGLFARYAGRVVERLGPSVTYWLTINEPTVYVSQAYLNGAWPPMELNAWGRAARVLRQMARAHVAAYEALKGREPDARVSFAHNALWMEPCDPRRWLDRLAAGMRDYVYNSLFFRLIGASTTTPRHLDYVALNYYTRCCVRFSGRGPTAVLGRACRLDHHEGAGRRGDVGWEVYPQGLAGALGRFRRLKLPLFVTENGIATVDDDLRCEYIESHLEVLAGAIDNGVEVLGYLHWSLMDNYEWDRGTSAQFGLAAVDHTSQVRTPRRSAQVLARICQANRI
jgi:beta-glucosidase